MVKQAAKQWSKGPTKKRNGIHYKKKRIVGLKTKNYTKIM